MNSEPSPGFAAHVGTLLDAADNLVCEVRDVRVAGRAAQAGAPLSFRPSVQGVQRLQQRQDGYVLVAAGRTLRIRLEQCEVHLGNPYAQGVTVA
jgi:hypothetical protein